MKTKYVLVDCENVQPAGFELLRDDAFKVKMFIGAKQNTPKNAKRALECLGGNAERIKISGNGKNAADFHIAYYIGRLSAESKDIIFYIVSKDKGFDPLIKHLQMHEVNCSRVDSLEKIAPTQSAPKRESAGAKKPEAKPKVTKAVSKRMPTAAVLTPKAKQATMKALPKKKPSEAKSAPVSANTAENTKAGVAKHSKTPPIPPSTTKKSKALPKTPASAKKTAPSSAQESAALGMQPVFAGSSAPNPRKNSAKPMSSTHLADTVIANLGTGRKPGLVENLKIAIKDLSMELLNKPLSAGEVNATIEEMKRRGLIKIADGIVSYIAPYKQIP